VKDNAKSVLTNFQTNVENAFKKDETTAAPAVPAFPSSLF
jgi:hypothetical protein